MEEKIHIEPCPFCGGDAETRRIDYGMRYDKFTENWRTECSNCGAHPGKYGYETIIKRNDNGELVIEKDGRKESIDAWNKRPSYRPKVAYICDKKQCANCSYPTCQHTTIIEHAKNFKCMNSDDGDKYMEVEKDITDIAKAVSCMFTATEKKCGFN